MITTPKPLATMEKLIDKWRKKPKDEAIRKEITQFLEDPDYQNMGTGGENYILRNRPFLTAHKLKCFKENPFFAYLAYEKEEVMDFEEPEAFVIGQAVDDYLTHGKKSFEDKYEIVSRRKDESEKIQLTNGQGKTVLNAAAEYETRHFFPKKPVKQNIVFLLLGKIPCKIELDHLEFGSHFGDVKTTANIETFDPLKWEYDFLMSFYYSGILELYNEKLPGHLYVLDKNASQCRSDCFVFRVETLSAWQPRILELIKEYVQCQVSGIWPFRLDLNSSKEDRVKFFRSQFYSHPLCQPFKNRMEPIYL